MFPRLAPARTSKRIGAFHFLLAYNGTSSSPTSDDISDDGIDNDDDDLVVVVVFFEIVVRRLRASSSFFVVIVRPFSFETPATSSSTSSSSSSSTHRAIRGKSRATTSHPAITLSCARFIPSNPRTEHVTRVEPRGRSRSIRAMDVATETVVRSAFPMTAPDVDVDASAVVSVGARWTPPSVDNAVRNMPSASQSKVVCVLWTRLARASARGRKRIGNFTNNDESDD